jgi:hypothetical protein
MAFKIQTEKKLPTIGYTKVLRGMGQFPWASQAQEGDIIGIAATAHRRTNNYVSLSYIRFIVKGAGYKAFEANLATLTPVLKPYHLQTYEEIVDASFQRYFRFEHDEMDTLNWKETSDEPNSKHETKEVIFYKSFLAICSLEDGRDTNFKECIDTSIFFLCPPTEIKSAHDLFLYENELKFYKELLTENTLPKPRSQDDTLESFTYS